MKLARALRFYLAVLNSWFYMCKTYPLVTSIVLLTVSQVFTLYLVLIMFIEGKILNFTMDYLIIIANALMHVLTTDIFIGKYAITENVVSTQLSEFFFVIISFSFLCYYHFCELLKSITSCSPYQRKTIFIIQTLCGFIYLDINTN